MARRGNKRISKMPPLSFLDKLIYWIALFLLCGISFALCGGALYLRHLIAFSDKTVVATAASASVIWFLLPFLTFFLITFILWLQFYENRRPIFGRKNFKYGPPAWPQVYPLFMRNKPYVYISEKKKKDKKLVAIILIVVLLIGLIPLPLSLCGRVCLHEDGRITQYNMFNKQVHEFTSADILEVDIEAYRYYSRYKHATHCGVAMKFNTDDGRSYGFNQGDFLRDGNADTTYWLCAMLQVKKCYNQSVFRYYNIENLGYVVDTFGLSEEDSDRLYDLLGR